MASLCLTRSTDAFSLVLPTLCGSEHSKRFLRILPGMPVLGLLLNAGAPEVCPECAVAQALSDAHNPKQRQAAVDALLLRVRREAYGTERGAETLERYQDAARQALAKAA